MKQAHPNPRWFFVDEAGDPNFYAKKTRKIIVGEKGCSRAFMMGFIRTNEPQQLRSKLAEVRLEISQSKDLNKIPSVRQSLLYFHATDDCPEVRKLVYEALEKSDFSAQIVVARKIEKVFVEKYKASNDEFYCDLVTRLFFSQLHLAAENHITFSRRGSKLRQRSLRRAVEIGAQRFRDKHEHDVKTVIDIDTRGPIQEPALQVVDYVNWAVQRAFERGEMRYFDFLREKIEIVRDIFDFEKKDNKGKVHYDRWKNPFDIKKASSLG
jgi:hypothetical protein